MIPETYNIKKESFVNICKSCDWLCNSFRLALLEGSHDRAVALHATGNVNLHTPFANVKGELFYPVHCAVLGRNINLLKFLVDENCCPIKSVRVSGTSRDSQTKYTAIVTSKGRSLLGIAMQNEDVAIVRYLVVEKGIPLSGEKDVTMDLLCRNLTNVLHMLPPAGQSPLEGSCVSGLSRREEAPIFAEDYDGVAPLPPSRSNFADEPDARTLSEEARDFGAVKVAGKASRRTSQQDEEVDDSVSDECIICFDGAIDCVATPCGHQICCLRCSRKITTCPVCSATCSFMRVFKP
jgi:hypothetical protein